MDYLQDVIKAFKQLPKVKDEPSFLAIANFPNRETAWQSIFAFFLNPNKCHGFHELVLRSFFEAIGKADQNLGGIQNVKVNAECLTHQGNRLDLFIQGDSYVVGIEMKVGAGLNNPLEDYADYIKGEAQGKEQYRIVLSLQPHGCTSDFDNLLWSKLIDVIKSNMDDYLSTAHPKYATFFIDFINHVSHYQGDQPMSQDEKSRHAFMQKNHKEVREIIIAHEQCCSTIERKMEHLCRMLKEKFEKEGMPIEDFLYRFTYRGLSLSKFCTSVNGVQFYIQFGYTGDYKIWLNPYVPNKKDGHLCQKVRNQLKLPAYYNCFDETIEDEVEAKVRAIITEFTESSTVTEIAESSTV